MMVLPHLRLILPFSSRYLTTAIDNSLTDMCGPGLGNHERLRGRAGGLKGPAHYGNSLGFRLSFRLTGAASCLPTTGDLFELSRFVIADHSPQRCVLCQNVAKPLVISTAPCKAGAEGFSQCAN